MDLGLKGKRALVLGASRGLGKEIAASLAREGVEVTAAARRQELIDDWAGGMSNVTTKRVDLADFDTVAALAEGLLKDGGVDILVNNSGGPAPGQAHSTDRGAWIAQFEAMAANVFELTRLLLPPMRERGWGRILTIGSSGIIQPIPNLAMSNGVRSAVLGWSRTLAAEVARDGVTVNMILPGRIGTERVDELDAAASKRTGKSIEDIAAAARETIPAGRYGRPEEFADVAVFLVSERASYVTGSQIRVDGGLIRSV